MKNGEIFSHRFFILVGTITLNRPQKVYIVILTKVGILDFRFLGNDRLKERLPLIAQVENNLIIHAKFHPIQQPQILYEKTLELSVYPTFCIARLE